ncbi:MAG: hypothetical protein M0Z40_16880 [Actinomycetota bacterium]|nr:hypothetical protein [Actinomycetota bacterium]
MDCLRGAPDEPAYSPSGDQAVAIVGAVADPQTGVESAVSVERGVDLDAILGGPSPVGATPRAQARPEGGGSTSSDPLIAAVQRRLAARGRPVALLASLSPRAAEGPSPLGGHDGGK